MTHLPQDHTQTGKVPAARQGAPACAGANGEAARGRGTANNAIRGPSISGSVRGWSRMERKSSERYRKLIIARTIYEKRAKNV